MLFVLDLYTETVTPNSVLLLTLGASGNGKIKISSNLYRDNKSAKDSDGYRTTGNN